MASLSHFASIAMILEVKLKIFGHVQGVCYRAEAQEKANELNIKGWAKNCTDGTVEICAQGEHKKLPSFVEWCKEGPTKADVDTMDIRFELAPKKLFKDFSIF